MDFFSCFACCGKRGAGLQKQESQQKFSNDFASFEQKKVMQLFTEFEDKLKCLKQIPIEGFLKEVSLLSSFDGSISTRQLSIIYQKFGIQFTSLITFFAQEFFFKNQVGAEYDVLKVQLFNILYCSSTDLASDQSLKQKLLYEVLTEGLDLTRVGPNDEEIISRLEILTMIPTLLIANIIEQQNRFNSSIEEEKVLMQELEKVQKLLIDSTQSQLLEFAGMLSRDFFFAFKGSRYKILTQEEFVSKCSKRKLKLTVAKQLRIKFIRMLENKQLGQEGKNSVSFSTINHKNQNGKNLYRQEYEDCLEEEEDEDFDEDLFIEQFAPNLKNKGKSKKDRYRKDDSLQRSIEQQLEKPKFTFTTFDMERKTCLDNKLSDKLVIGGSIGDQKKSSLSESDGSQHVGSKYGKRLMELYWQFLEEGQAVKGKKAIEMNKRFRRNREYLNSLPKLTFNLEKDQEGLELHPMIKDIFQYIKVNVTVQDLKELLNGSYFEEGIQSAYLKILELYSHIQNELFDYSTLSNPNQSPNSQPSKVMFLKVNQVMEVQEITASVIKKIQNQPVTQKFIDSLQIKDLDKFFEKTSIIAPVFFNLPEDIDIPGRKQSVLVHMGIKDLSAELYYKHSELYDNGDISENVLSLFDLASAINEVHFDDEEVEGKVREIEAATEEDMIVYGCYIAECLTFKRPIDLQSKSMEFLRSRVVDAIINLSYI